MKALYSPIIPADENSFTEYIFDGETVTANIDGEIDTFDFSTLLEGEEVGEVITALPMNPIESAKRVDGVVEVILRKFISPDAPEEEKFPNWVVV